MKKVSVCLFQLLILSTFCHAKISYYTNFFIAGASAGVGSPLNYLDLLQSSANSSYSKLYGSGHLQPPPTSSPAPTTPTSSVAGGQPPTAAAAGPHICNWMHGREYCGKRFPTAEELLIHLKTHTNLSVSDNLAANAAALAAASVNGHPPPPAVSSPSTMSPFGGHYNPSIAALLGANGAAAAAASLRSTFPSPLSAAAMGGSLRYSPYSKPPPPSAVGYPLPPSLSTLGGGGGIGGGAFPHLAADPHSHSAAYLSYLAAANPLSLYGLYGAR